MNEIHDRTLTLDEHITNHVIKFRKEDGQLILPGEQRNQPISDTLSKLDVTLYDTNNRNSSLSGKLLSWMSKLRDEDNSDYYFDFTDYRKPKLFSSMTKMEYDPLSDIDESDFASFKHGYTIIQRVLLRTKYWPTCNPLHPSVDEKIQFMLRVCLEKMCSILLYIIKNTEHLKLNRNAIMGVMDEIKMDSGITMESTPIKAENKNRKRKLELDPNETQGPLMNNPMEPVFKPGPSGDNTDNSKSESTSNESSPKRRKKTPVKTAKRRLTYKDPCNEVPKLTIDRHRMKVVWKSIPENSSLDELERKLELENKLIDTGDLEPGEIPSRDEKTLKDILIGIDEETLKYRQELKEKLKKNPMTKDQAESTVNWAFSGNQQCYSLAERDSGYSIRELISIANGEVEVSEEDMEVMSDSRSSVPTTPECDVVVISDSEPETSPLKIDIKDDTPNEAFPMGIRSHSKSY